MYADRKIQKDVIDELRALPNLTDLELGVAVKDGVVTLTGTVASYAQKLEAAQAARGVHQVLAVADETEVRLPGAAQRTDTEIAHAAVDALRWNVEVPEGRIRLTVHNGWVTMEGQVDWQFQRRAAERAVRWLTGVKGVIDRVVVEQPRVAPDEVQRRIGEALRRSATVDAGRITVEALDRKVTLRGTVRSWAEREDAEAAAWAVPGVTAVDDFLTVTP